MKPTTFYIYNLLEKTTNAVIGLPNAKSTQCENLCQGLINTTKPAAWGLTMNNVERRAALCAAGQKGGRARVAKGFAKMNPERRREIAIMASKKAAELRSAKAKKGGKK